jgi:Membrane protein involved in the export of O-antigen and teichoic acid
MSTTAKNTLRNTALLVAFEVANPLLSLLLVGTMARRLGPEGTGAYNLLLNFFFVAHSMTSLGLNSLITREVSRARESARQFLASSASLGMLVSLVVAAGVVLAVRLLGYSHEIWLGGWFVALSLFPSIVILYSEAIFIAFERVQYIVILAMIENVGRVTVGLWLLVHGYGVVPLIASFAAFRFLTLFMNLVLFHNRITTLSWSYNPRVVRELVKNVPVFGTIFVVATLYWRADVFLLSKMTTLTAVGFYTAGYRLFAIAQVIPKSFNTSIYPVFSKLFHRSPESFQRANSLSIRYILVALLPVAAGVCGLAEPLVRLLFGPDFLPAAGVLKVVIWTVVPYGIVRVLASGLFASNRQVIDLKVNLLGLVANLALNLFLIPKFGMMGCAWATMLSIWIFLALQCYFLRGEILPVLRQAEILRPGAAAGGILIWLALTPDFKLVYRILGGAIIYSLLLAVLRVIRLTDLRAIMPERLSAHLPGGHEP